MSSLSAVTVGGVIHPVLWNARVGDGLPVGTCRICDGPMIGRAPRRWNGTRWYEAECRDCGHEIASANGKLAAKYEPDLVAV